MSTATMARTRKATKRTRTAATTTPKFDAYQAVTDQVVAMLQAGTAPGHMPCDPSVGMPRSLGTGKPYRGVNRSYSRWRPLEKRSAREKGPARNPPSESAIAECLTDGKGMLLCGFCLGGDCARVTLVGCPGTVTSRDSDAREGENNVEGNSFMAEHDDVDR
jgi:N-terminal domain of anti-restriction factor ArdC